jgi:hypothetical protein
MDVIFSSANKSLGAPLGVSVESVLLSTDSHITGIVMFWSIVFKETVASVLSSMHWSRRIQMTANECIWMQMNADESRWTWDPLIVCRLICFDSIPVCRRGEGIFFTSQGTTIIEKIAYVKMISWSARHVVLRVTAAASLDAHTCHFALSSQMTFR